MRMPKKLLVVGSFLLVAVIAAAIVVQPNHPSTTGSAGSGDVRSSTSPDGTQAHVRASGRAIPDPLSLHVVRSYTTHAIRNQYVPSTAHGVFLVMDVTATNTTGHVVAFDGGQISLTLNGTRYSPSPNALTALDLSGHTTFAEDDLEPSASATGWVAFDVPPGVLTSSAQLCLVQRGAGASPVC